MGNSSYSFVFTVYELITKKDFNMPIHFNNLSSFGITNKNIKVNSAKSEVSFKGVEPDNSSKKDEPIQSISYASVQLHPLVEFNLQLLKDGYTKDELNEHSVFFTSQVNTDSLCCPDLLVSVMSGEITKNDIFSKHLKSNADIKAMQRAYVALKEKFNSSDVREHVAKMVKLEEEMSSFFAKKGIETPAKAKYSSKAMMLSVLHYVNKDNEPLLQALLNDENFNNVNITNALMSLDEHKDVRYSLAVLKMAQDIGYDKDFSFPLSILISEANSSNIGMIEKMLGEQEFLCENSDFVSNKLMGFLRDAGSGLSAIYEEDPDLTLVEVQELLELEDDEY